MSESGTSIRREVATLAPPALLLAGMLEVAARHDAGHRALGLAVLAVGITQVLPGALIWRLVRPVNGWLIEDLVMGLIVGIALTVPSQILAAATGQRWVAGALPIVLALVVVAVPGPRARIRSRTTSALPWAWGAAVVVSAVGPLLDVLSTFLTPLRWRGWTSLPVDVPFHQALTGEVLHHFPPHYPQAALEPLMYHWFAHAWTAQTAAASGTEIGALLWRFNPALLMVAAPLAVAVAAMRLSGRAWAGPTAALLAFLLPDLVPWGASIMSSPLHTAMSPTQQLAGFIVAGLVTLLALRWRAEASGWSMPVLLLLLAITGGTKGSTLPVIFAGMLTATAAMAVQRSRVLRTVALDTLVAGGTLVLLMAVVFGDGGHLTLDFGRTFIESDLFTGMWGRGITSGAVVAASAAGVAVGVLTVLTFLLGPAAGFSLLGHRETLRDPATWLLVGGGAAGLGAMVMFALTSFAQIYFYKPAEALIALGAAWGAATLLARAGSARILTAGGIVTGIVALPLVHLAFARTAAPGLGRALAALFALLILAALGAAVVARATRTGGRGFLAVAAIALIAAPSTAAAQSVIGWHRPPPLVRSTPMAGGITFGDVEAMRWLRAHSQPGDLVATNRHCRNGAGDPCDRRWFFIGAYAERRVLIEGWTYTGRAASLYAEFGPSNFTDAQFWDQDLLALNDGFIAGPDAVRAAKLWDLGVRWIVVWQDAPHADDLAPFARPAHRGSTLTIHQLAQP